MPRTGGCLCGAIRYESDGDVLFALRCHCRDCQRQSGAASVAAIRVPSAGFRVLRGAPKTFVARADSGNDITRAFCGDCGTPLYVQVATRPDMVGLRVCTLDDPGWFRPEADIFVRSAQPWEPVDPAVPQFPHYPPGRSYPVTGRESAAKRGKVATLDIGGVCPYPPRLRSTGTERLSHESS